MNTLAQNAALSAAFQDEIVVFPSQEFTTSTVFPQHRVRVTPQTSPWMRKLEARFNEIVALPSGWDGYGGLPVAFATAQFAAQVIERLYDKGVPTPSVVPGSDGSLQIEWHTNGFDIELDFLGPLNVDAYRLDKISGDKEELHLESDFTQVAIWISNLLKDREHNRLLVGQ